MRRWEDWERSRLRKLKREERRRRDFERAHPAGYIAGENFLVAPDARSQYDGSDTFSLNSSDDDHWGTQIGGYNEHNSQFPPPPTAFIPKGDALQSAKTVDSTELEAMLQMGFDDRPPTSPTYIPRYQLSDGSTRQVTNGGGYAPLTQSVSPGTSQTALLNPTSPVHMSRELPGNAQRLMPGTESGGHGERYGPLGPLDPSAKF